MNRCTPVGSSGTKGFILAHLYLVQTRPLDRPTVPSNGPLVHPTMLSSQLFFSNSSDAARKATVGSSDDIKLISAFA
jgi:hypothetical protein